jgi:hypothetical protein
MLPHAKDSSGHVGHQKGRPPSWALQSTLLPLQISVHIDHGVMTGMDVFIPFGVLTSEDLEQ